MLYEQVEKSDSSIPVGSKMKKESYVAYLQNNICKYMFLISRFKFRYMAWRMYVVLKYEQYFKASSMPLKNSNVKLLFIQLFQINWRWFNFERYCI